MRYVFEIKKYDLDGFYKSLRPLNLCPQHDSSSRNHKTQARRRNQYMKCTCNKGKR